MNKNTYIIISIIALVIIVFGIIWTKNNTNKTPENINITTGGNDQEDIPFTPKEDRAPAEEIPAKPAPATQPAIKGYTFAEVATHSNASSCWTIIRSEVYDLTTWIGQHPGGEKAILSLCGKDGTAAFEGQHGGQQKQEETLAKFKLGAYIK